MKYKFTCQYPDCTEDHVSTCENCDTQFCLDHGSPRQPHGPNDYISVCWNCGGYNADE